MRHGIKFWAGFIITAAMVFGLFAASVYALPTAYIDDGIEDAAGTKDVAKMFEGTQLWIGNQEDLKQMGLDGKVGISSKSSNATKGYVIDGNKSIYAVNYLNDNMTGDPYKEWCNIWMTHDSNFGLKNSSTYVVSFLLRTYTEWEPEATVSKLQNFGIVSIRNWRYKSGSSIVDFYVQPNIQGEDVSADQMVRVDDKTVPQNSKNTMSIKKLNDNTLSVVCKFVTSVPTTEPEVGKDKWFVSFTFHGPGIVSCDNIRAYQSDLALSAFHQKLPSGSADTSKPASSAKPSQSSPADATSSAAAGSDTSDADNPSEAGMPSETSEAVVSGGSQESSATVSGDSTADTPDGDSNAGAVIAIIITALVVVAGGGAALYFLVLKKKA